LLPRRGFLLHAATVVRDGRAYVFTGRSGAGKSTVASLSPAGTVLTDEISLLRFTDGCWQAYGTPFWGEFRAAGQNEHYPIAGIYTLVQSTEDRVESMTTKEIVRALLPCVLFFSSQVDANEELLHVLFGMVRQVPCHRLHFRRDKGFWEVITA
jgi:energy-coupling factor transporter ATP-binding protein EcfA2